MAISPYLASLCQNEEERLFCSRIADLFSTVEQKGFCRFSFFLNERQALLAQKVGESMGASFAFTGGYPDAQRRVLCAFPEWMDETAVLEETPVVPVTFTYRKTDKLSHRDFLGSLMALQIKREMVGDILPGEGICILFAHENTAQLILTEIQQIGRVGVSASEGFDVERLPRPSFQELDLVVSSLRLDGIVAALTKQGREAASGLVKGGHVQLNYVENLPGSRQVSQGDILSIRGYGKYRLIEVLGQTKKGRMRVLAQKYV